MEFVTTAVKVAKLVPPAIKAAKRAKKRLEDRQIQKELEECLKDAEKAFRDRVPKGMAVHPDILSKFFDGPVFEFPTTWLGMCPP